MKRSNINLIYVPMEKLKTTTIGVYIYRNLNEKDVSKNAILPYVLKQGCRLCPDSESMSKYLEELYGATLSAGVIKMGANHVMRFEAQTISDRYAAEGEPLTEDLLKLILSVMFEPAEKDGAFKQSVIDIEKKNARDRIMSEMNDKRSYAMQRCIAEICRGEEYALSKYGTVEGIDEISANGLYEYYKDAITSSVIDIYVLGEADEGKLQGLIDEKTSGIEFKDAKIAETKIHKNSGEVNNVTEHMDINQGKLAIGFSAEVDAKSDERFSLMVMNSVFGYGPHSKLFNNIREKLSLAYYAGTALIAQKGVIIMNAGIEFENFQKAHDETLVQLKAVQDGDITETEINAAINALNNQLESLKDNPAQLHSYMAQQRVIGVDCDIDYAKERIKAVTIEDVVEIAKKVKVETVYFLAGGER